MVHQKAWLLNITLSVCWFINPIQHFEVRVCFQNFMAVWYFSKHSSKRNLAKTTYDNTTLSPSFCLENQMHLCYYAP